MTARLLSTAPSIREANETMLFKRILFVENDAHLAKEVRDTLDLHFYDVTVVTSGAMAVTTLLRDKFDLILCDLTMPSFPGQMFYEAVKRVKPMLCKRFISITNSAQSRLNGKTIGELSIWKPLDMQILLEAIETVLRKSQAANSGNVLANDVA